MPGCWTIATGSGEMFRRLVKTNPDGKTFGLDLVRRTWAARTQRRARKEFPSAEAHCGRGRCSQHAFSECELRCSGVLLSAGVCWAQDDIRLTLRREIARSPAARRPIFAGRDRRERQDV